MNLQEVACLLADKLRLVGYSLSGSDKTIQCPDEADLLSYAEKRLSPARRANLEGHIGNCDDCRESLALFARISGEETESAEAVDPSISDELIRRQTDRVLAFIALDEENQLPPRPRREPVKLAKPQRSGFSLSYAQLSFVATLVIVAAVGINYMATGSVEAQMEGTLTKALELDRRITPRISGRREHSPNSVTRGASNTEEELFDFAIDKLKFAEKESAPTKARQILARVYLSRDKPDDSDKALNILRELVTRPDVTPEIWNDLGVAFYQSRNMDEAIRAFSEAIVQKPGYQEALFNRGLANKDAKNYHAASRDFNQFLELSSDEKWNQEAQEWLDKL